MEDEDNKIFKEMLEVLEDLDSQVDSFLNKKISAQEKTFLPQADLDLKAEEALEQMTSSISCEDNQESTSYQEKEQQFLLNFIEMLIADFPEDKKDLVRQDAIKSMHKTTF